MQRSPLFTRKFRDRQSLDMTERIAVTLPNVQDDPQEETLEEEHEEAESAEPDEGKENILHVQYLKLYEKICNFWELESVN